MTRRVLMCGLGLLAVASSADRVLAVRAELGASGGALSHESCAWGGITDKAINGGLYVYKDAGAVGFGYRRKWATALPVIVGEVADVLLQVRPAGGGIQWSVTVDGVLCASGFDGSAPDYNWVWMAARNNAWHAATQVETDGGMFYSAWDGAGELAGWGVLSGLPQVGGGVLGARRDARGVASMLVSRHW